MEVAPKPGFCAGHGKIGNTCGVTGVSPVPGHGQPASWSQLFERQDAARRSEW